MSYAFSWHLIAGELGRTYVNNVVASSVKDRRWLVIATPKHELGKLTFDDWRPVGSATYTTWQEADTKAEGLATSKEDTFAYPTDIPIFKIVSSSGLVYRGHPEKEWGVQELLKDLADDSDSKVYYAPQTLKSSYVF